MMDIENISSQLWDSEKEILHERASLVPQNGVVVEIGTAQGGSSIILHEATRDRNVIIYTYDIAPSDEAYDLLKGKNVKIFAQPSIQGAQEWNETSGKPIDLLFIDGSHALENVFEDFNEWVHHLRPGGEVIFHDFDSEERGGLIHLGTEIFLRTLLAKDILKDYFHQERLLIGKIDNPSQTSIAPSDCYQTIVNLGRHIVNTRDKDFTGWNLYGDESMNKVMAGCLDISYSEKSIEDISEMINKGKCLVLIRPLLPFLEKFREIITQKQFIVVNNLIACYLIDHGLRKDREYLLKLAHSRNEFFRWEEMLSMFEHAFGPLHFPDAIEYVEKENIHSLSRFVAKEQIRLFILGRLFEQLVGYKP